MNMAIHNISNNPTSPNIKNKLINVILVEDYNLTRVGIRSFLSKYENIKVIGEAENAEKGLSLIRRLRPDVVLMDLGLPGMNGIEATQQIKAFDENIKVVVLTSHEREEEVIAALGSGANAYCLKDIDAARLAEAIETVASGGAWLDPAVASVALKLCPKPNEGGKITPVKSRHDNKAQLTEREMEVLRLLVEGMSNTEIANELIVSVHTAKAHVCNILQKLYVNDRVQAAVKAIREGLV
jgi:DNA-binding NarL/FixJ family response regulator